MMIYYAILCYAVLCCVVLCYSMLCLCYTTHGLSCYCHVDSPGVGREGKGREKMRRKKGAACTAFE